MNLKSKSGFTLIELLVVVAIVSLLSSIVFASLNSARGKARNAVRIASVKQLMNAFYLGLNNGNSFPIAASGWACIASSCYAAAGGFYSPDATVTAFLLANMSSLPSDPVDGVRMWNGQPFGGYNYNGNWSGGASFIDPFTGITNNFPAGTVIQYPLELPATKCGPGVLNFVGPNNLSCVVYLN